MLYLNLHCNVCSIYTDRAMHVCMLVKRMLFHEVTALCLRKVKKTVPILLSDDFRQSTCHHLYRQ